MRLEDLKGRRLGRYEIVEVLGRGGMAAVYRARDTVLRRDVALKILYPQYTGDVALTERFQREAVLAAGLDHPNILPIYDVGEGDGLVYIAMRLLSGQSFADTLRLRGALPTAELLPIVDQVAAALDYAHARQIVHRDIKPGNILIESADAGDLSHARAILTDFGIAKSLDATARGLTATGVLIGTPEYMAPEQIRGGHTVDGRADIYALGVLIYRALTGRRPFEGSTEEVLMGHLHGAFTPPSQLDPQLTPAIDAVLRRALARDPSQRYASAGELARALRAATGFELPTPPPALRRPSDARVVVPHIAVGEMAGGAAQPTNRGDAAPPYARPTVPANRASAAPPPPPARSGSPLAWVLLGLVLALAVGGGWLYAAGLLGGSRANSQLPAPPGPTRALATFAPTVPAAPTAPQPTDAAPTSVAAAPTATSAPATAGPTQAPSPPPSSAPTRPQATQAPTSTPTPEPTAPPTPTPEPTAPPCPIAAGDAFARLLENQPSVAERLGCAAQDSQERAVAEEPFERGAMLWLADPQSGGGTIYVIARESGSSTKNTWQSFEDTWREGDPADSGDKTPPAGLLEPLRGFGRLWYANQSVADALGWATAAESAGTGVTQRFANGRLVYSSLGFGNGPAINVLYQDGTFETYPA